MDVLDTIWHLLNFVAPAAFVGVVTPLIAQALWRRRLRSVRWWTLIAWSAGAALSALVLGLLVFGRDGRIATYAAVVLASAVALWWAGLRKA